MKQIGEERTMTVKEVAEALGVAYDTVAKHARTLGYTENGKQTLLTEYQTLEIKNRIGKHDLLLSSKVESAVTEIEKDETILKELENGKVIYDRRITQTGREMIINLLRCKE